MLTKTEPQGTGQGHGPDQQGQEQGLTSSHLQGLE